MIEPTRVEHKKEHLELQNSGSVGARKIGFKRLKKGI